MGLFTNVEVSNELMPEEYRNLTGWQTKDVVDPFMETLVVCDNGQLVYIWYEREWEENPDSLFGGYLRQKKEHRDILSYHGDMVFYTSTGKQSDNTYKFVQLKARFTNGILNWIEEFEYEERQYE